MNMMYDLLSFCRLLSQQIAEESLLIRKLEHKTVKSEMFHRFKGNFEDQHTL